MEEEEDSEEKEIERKLTAKNENEPIVTKITQHFSRYKTITKEIVLKSLIKQYKIRTDVENRMIADYLSHNYDYFKRIKETNQKQFLKLISVLSFETYLPGDLIINVDYEEDKFFILFEGSVQVFRQNFYEKEMKLGDFCDYLFYIQKTDEKQYLRLINHNKNLGINFDELRENPYFNVFKIKKFIFNIEELEEIGKFGNGYVFGEMNLIRKRKRDIIVKSLNKTDVISVNKFDFNRILKTIEEKRLELLSERFRKRFSMFRFWSMEQLITLFNYCSYTVFHKDDYIYKQNEPSQYIYFVEKGKFEQYCNTGYSWYKDYIEYIGNLNDNLINIILAKKPENYKRLREIYEEEIQKQEKKNNLISSNKIENLKFLNNRDIYLEQKKTYDKYEKTDNLLYIKKEEDKLNDPNNIIKISLLTTEMPKVLGMDEPFEFKRRFTSVKCLSGKVVAKRINVYDLLKLLLLYKEFKYSEKFLNLLIQKRIVLIDTIKSHLKKEAKIFEKEIKLQYDLLISQNDNIDKKIVMAKLKGWNNGLYLDNILDTSLHLFKPKSEKIVKEEKNEIDNIVRNFMHKIPDKNIKKVNKTFLNIIKNKDRQPFLLTERREKYIIRESSEETMLNNIKNIKIAINAYNNKKTNNNYFTPYKKTDDSMYKCDLGKKLRKRSHINKKLLINNINMEMRKIVMNKFTTPRIESEKKFKKFDKGRNGYLALKINNIKNNDSKSNKSNSIFSFSRTFYSNNKIKSDRDKNIRNESNNSNLMNKVESFYNIKDSFSNESKSKNKERYILPSLIISPNKNDFKEGMNKYFKLNKIS